MIHCNRYDCEYNDGDGYCESFFPCEHKDGEGDEYYDDQDDVN